MGIVVAYVRKDIMSKCHVIVFFLFILCVLLSLICLLLLLPVTSGHLIKTVGNDTELSRNEIDPATLHEDQRAASQMAAALSGMVMSSSLAVLAGLATFVVFLLKKGSTTPRLLVCYLWRLFAIVATIALVLSIVIGGRSITRLYKSGFEGRWDYESAAGGFGVQATLCLLGLICTMLTIIFGCLCVGKQVPERPNDTSGESV